MKKVIYAMLLFVPITLLLDFVFKADPILIFVCAGLGIIPLADLIGTSTEEIAVRVGPKFGGLLNATLGNAAELIITILALRAGLVDLVRASITGSIIGNLLLIMGLSILLGGLKHGTQTFDRRSAGLNATMLLLVVIALLVPSLFDVAIANNLAAELGLSEGVAIVMIVLYALSILYSFTQGGDATHGSHAGESAADAPPVNLRRSIILLIVATLGIVFMSEILVSVIEVVTVRLGLTEFFIGVIVVPLVGNIAEHLVAVQVAAKNRMELSMAISLGSSIQIALFVAPVLVFISLLFGNPLLLVFNTFELIALIGAAFIAAFVAQDGESNWLEGAMLLAVYIILAIAFFFLPSDGEAGDTGAHEGSAVPRSALVVEHTPSVLGVDWD